MAGDPAINPQVRHRPAIVSLLFNSQKNLAAGQKKPKMGPLGVFYS